MNKESTNSIPSHQVKPLVVFTGGGTAGHVTPNIALIHEMTQRGWRVAYLGSEDGIESTLIRSRNIDYYSIATGKLRRYFSWQNFLDPFKIVLGIFQAFKHLFQLKPDVVFSKGGFVSFPVVFAAWCLRIPVVAHESDLSPGLTNKLCLPFVKTLCVSFPSAMQYYSNHSKLVITGIPLREGLLNGDADRGRAFCGFSPDKPILMVFGGGLGSVAINNAVRAILPNLLTHLNIIHLCGKGKTDPAYEQLTGYQQYEYIDSDLPDLFACADLFVSRSGANSVFELLALRKPHILIPLSKVSSRGDQIENAAYTQSLGLSVVIQESELTPVFLETKINTLLRDLDEYKQRLKQYPVPQSVTIVADLLVSGID